jgi:hypothetical protein
MPGIDPIELGKWERRETERHRAIRVFRGARHNYLPRVLGWNPSLIRVAFSALRFLSFLALSLLPVWVKYFDESSPFSWKTALWLSSAISTLLLFDFFYDRFASGWKTKGVRSQLLRKLSNDLRGTIANFSSVVKLTREEHRPLVNAARKNVLELIRRVTQIHVGDYEGAHIEVTLLLFEDSDCRQMRIVDRTTASRSVNTIVNSDEVMAFFVAKSGKHRVVNDFLKDNHPFRKTGLSGPDPPYRSILLIPLLDTASGSPDSCVGVVSIDSSRPYHFWPGGGADLVVKVSPYCTWVMLLLTLNRDLHRLRLPA